MSDAAETVIESPRLSITVRERTAREGETLTGEPREALRAAILAASRLRRGEIRWAGDEHLAVLDIDDVAETTSADALLAGLAVRPWLAWISASGRGMHAVYYATEYPAGDLARCAAVSVAEVDRGAGVEVLTRTAAPPGDVSECGQEAEPRLPLGWLEDAEVDPAVLDEWLEARDLRIGGRYPHESCPIDPRPTTGTAPVVVQDDGIRCYVCGSRRTFARLISGRRPSLIATAARHLVHWTHAHYILAEERPDIARRAGFARAVYRSLAALTHGPDDPRLGSMFHPSLRIVRLSGCWADSATLAPLTGHGRQVFASLPSVRYLDEAGEPKASPIELALAASNATLPGYAEVVPVRGLRLWGVHNDYPQDRRVRGVLPTEAAYPPRYVPPSHRMDESAAWARIETEFPGIDRAYLSLLLAARGVAESGAGAVPMVLVEGPSGGGKSATVLLAAEILGDVAKVVQPSTAVELFDRTFGQHAASGAGFIRLDEFAKTTSDARIREQFEPLFLVERDYTCARMYVGQISVPVRSVVVVSRVSFPTAVFSEPQITRRFVCLRLPGATPDWRDTSGGIEGWRDRSATNARAADAIISAVVDRHLAAGAPPDVRRIAEALGIEAPRYQIGLEDALPEERLETARAVYRLWLAIPGGTIPGDSARAATGWRVVDPAGQDPLSLAWREVCDDPERRWGGTRGISAEDLSTLVGFPRGTQIQCSQRGGKTLVRFVVGSGRGRRSGPVNEAIEFEPRRELCSSTDAPAAESTEPTTERSTAPPETPIESGRSAPPAEPSSPSASSPSQSPPSNGALPVVIDLETRSDLELKAVGGRVYAEGRHTEIICGAARMPDGEIVSWQHASADLPDYSPPGVAPVQINGHELYAHNADGFDRHIWERFYGAAAGWVDTLKLARAAGHRNAGLDALGVACLGRSKQADGAALIRQYSKPRGTNPDGTPRFAVFFSDTLDRFVSYCREDVRLLADLLDGGHLTSGQTTETEARWVALQQRVNDRGIAYDADLGRALIRVQAAIDERTDLRIREVTGGMLDARAVKSRPAKVRRWLAEHGCDLPDLRKQTVTQYLAGSLDDGADELADAPPVSPAVRDVLEARLGIAGIVAAKCLAAQRTVSKDGRIRDMFRYYGGHTGRESGQGVQPQNLPRPTIDEDRLGSFRDRILAGETPDVPDLLDLARSALRGIFVSPPGRRLVWGDFAAIEARVLAWLAGQESTLEAFRAGRDVYVELASVIYGRPADEITREMRAVGKVGVLGAGYQMGAASCGVYCAAQGIDLAAAGTTPRALIEAYRRANPRIKGLWREVHDGAIATVRTREARTIGRVEWSMRDRSLIARLPSGRELTYHDAAIEPHVPVYKLRPDWQYDQDPVPTLVYGPEKGRVPTYGGKLVENVTQATARDLLVEAALAIDAETPIEIVGTIHDEILGEIDESDAGRAVEALEHFMSQTPEWAAGLPLAAEAKHAGRYGK